MAKAATDAPRMQAPPSYGRHFRVIFDVAFNLDSTRIAALRHHQELAKWGDEGVAYLAAQRRLDEAMDVVGISDDQPPHESLTDPMACADAIYAVLLRDRGLLTAADYNLLIAPWRAAGLPDVLVVTGDDQADALTAVQHMTSDRIADQLLVTAWGTQVYAATMLLTGYNYGELLAYETVRDAVRVLHDGSLRLDWEALRRGVTHGQELAGQLIEDEMDADATEFLLMALDLADNDDLADVITDTTDHNAATLVSAMAWVSGVEGLLDARWEPGTQLLPSSGSIPHPRAGEAGE